MNLATRIVSGIAVAFAAIQFVPYGREHTNPPVISEPTWDSPRTRELAVRACFDCHSNETKWPWYSNIAPLSWSVQEHVDEGREVLNFSEWNRTYEEAHEAGEEVAEGEMPLASYLPLHPEANLSDEERRALIDGLNRTLGGEAEDGEDGGATLGAAPADAPANAGHDARREADHDEDDDD